MYDLPVELDNHTVYLSDVLNEFIFSFESLESSSEATKEYVSECSDPTYFQITLSEVYKLLITH